MILFIVKASKNKMLDEFNSSSLIKSKNLGREEYEMRNRRERYARRANGA